MKRDRIQPHNESFFAGVLTFFLIMMIVLTKYQDDKLISNNKVLSFSKAKAKAISNHQYVSYNK